MDIRPGTIANNLMIFKQFVRFLRKHHLVFTQINEEILCCYAEFLTKQVKSPATIKNYMNALAATYERMGLYNSFFYHVKVKRATKALDKTHRHVVVPAQAVTPELLTQILLAIAEVPHFNTFRFLFIAMFMTLLRQSNFISSSTKAFDPTRQLTRGDVALTSGGLYFRVKWEKNSQSALGTNELIIPETRQSALSPIRAYINMIQAAPSARSSEPLIMFPDCNNFTVK